MFAILFGCFLCAESINVVFRSIISGNSVQLCIAYQQRENWQDNGGTETYCSITLCDTLTCIDCLVACSCGHCSPVLLKWHGRFVKVTNIVIKCDSSYSRCPYGTVHQLSDIAAACVVHRQFRRDQSYCALSLVPAARRQLCLGVHDAVAAVVHTIKHHHVIISDLRGSS